MTPPAVKPRGVRRQLADAMSEAQLQSAVLSQCVALGLLAYHTHDSRRSQSGFPDLTIVGAGGVLFRELKTEVGRPSSTQVTWLKALQAAGADAKVWSPWQFYDGSITRELMALRPAPVGQ